MLLFMFSSFIAHTQGIIDDQNQTDISDSFINEQQEINFITQQSGNTNQADLFSTDNSGIFINQIGDNNLANIRTESQAADIQLNQIGDLNRISLDLKADMINYQVRQQGTNNRLLEFQNLNGKQLILIFFVNLH